MSGTEPPFTPENFAGYFNVTGIRLDGNVVGSFVEQSEIGELILQPNQANLWNRLTYLYDITL